MDTKELNVTGTFVWYYYICKREVWLMGHSIEPDQDNPFIDLGRFINDDTYRRDKKEISLGNIRLDIVRKENGQIVVGEVKKSSKFKKSARMQLAFYLSELKRAGIDAKGMLMFPKEKKREEVILTEELIEQLELTKKDILRIIYSPKPQQPVKIPYCKNCGYRELCWS